MNQSPAPASTRAWRPRTPFYLCAALLSLLLSSHTALLTYASDTARPTPPRWVSVRSENFLLLGDAGAEDVRRVGVRLEQFRAALALLLGAEYFDDTVPTVVFVFRDEESYRPFKPRLGGRPEGVAGHFRSGADANYIAFPVAARGRADDATHATALHEYAHVLIKNRFGAEAPLWLSEGLAEFYSTLAVAPDSKRVTLGRLVAPHVQTLKRSTSATPLAVLLATTQDSRHYTDPEARRFFYAQSWALTHYLLEGPSDARREQFTRYLSQLTAGAPADESFARAFGDAGASALEQESHDYIMRARRDGRVVTLVQPLTWPHALQAVALSPAEALACEADLLLRMERDAEAENRLEQSLALDPNAPRALLVLGALRLRQNRVAEAREVLARAVAADPSNHLARYRHAEALSREAADAHLWVSDYTDARAGLMRAELRRAIELAPKFVEPYRLLAFVNLVREESLDESATLLRHALTLAPRRRDLALLLAQVHLRREEFDEARALLAKLASQKRAAPDAGTLAAHARALLDSIPRREELAAARRASAASTSSESSSLAQVQPCDMSPAGPQHKRMRFEGEQRCGQLVRVECDDTGVQLYVAVAGNEQSPPLMLRAPALSRVRFVTYTTEVKTGALTCGPREPSNPVLVTYRPAATGAHFGGEAVAVEFVPADWARREAPPAAQP